MNLFSPFSKHVLLHTNYTPTDAEILQIKNICAEPQREIHRLDLEISRLQAIRKELKDFVDAHQNMLSPIRRVSPEILQQIFIQCLPSHTKPAMHHSQAPVLLGRVCSRWRQIAIETPHLWSSVHVVIPRKFDLSASLLSVRRLKAMRLWLTRSGALPLHITLHAQPAHYSNIHSPCDASSFIQALVPYSPRWRHMELSMEHRFAQSLSTLKGEDVPMLHSFVFRNMNDFSPYYWQPPPGDGRQALESLHFLRLAPALKHLTAPMYDHDMWTPLSAQYITDLSLEFIHSPRSMQDPPLPHILGVLAKCQSLQNCSLKFKLSDFVLDHTTGRDGHDMVFTLQYLESLRLWSSSPFTPGQTGGVLATLFDHISLPKLRSLDISDHYSPFTSLHTFLKRSSCSLQKLAIRRLSVNPDILLPCLRSSPELEDLTLGFNAVMGLDETRMDYEFHNKFFGPMMAESDWLCPNLRIITFIDAFLGDGDDAVGDLHQFLQHRCHPPLHTVSLHHLIIESSTSVAPFDPERLRAKLQDLTEDGLQLTINASRLPPLEASAFLGLPRSS